MEKKPVSKSNITMFSKLLLLTSIALCSAAPSQPTSSPQPYILAKASDAAVSYAIKNRKSGVAESDARSAAVEMVNSAIAPSQATNLVMSAASYYANNGPTVAGPQAQQLASKASSYYDTLATQPAYKNYAKYVHENAKLFDVDAIVDNAQKEVVKQGRARNPQANMVASKASGAYASLSADPAGSDAIATGQELAHKVAKDFQIDTAEVKSRFNSAKIDITNMLAGF